MSSPWRSIRCAVSRWRAPRAITTTSKTTTRWPTSSGSPKVRSTDIWTSTSKGSEGSSAISSRVKSARNMGRRGVTGQGPSPRSVTSTAASSSTARATGGGRRPMRWPSCNARPSSAAARAPPSANAGRRTSSAISAAVPDPSAAGDTLSGPGCADHIGSPNLRSSATNANGPSSTSTPSPTNGCRAGSRRAASSIARSPAAPTSKPAAAATTPSMRRSGRRSPTPASASTPAPPTASPARSPSSFPA
jgi:hypothetical protein